MGGKETGEVSYKQRKVWRYSHQMANTGSSEEEDVGWRRDLSGRRKKSGKGEEEDPAWVHRSHLRKSCVYVYV